MTLRRQEAIATSETMTQEARIAALLARPSKPYRAGQCVLRAVASLFNSLPEH